MILVRETPLDRTAMTPQQQAAVDVLVEILVLAVVKEVTEEAQGEVVIPDDTKVASQ